MLLDFHTHSYMPAHMPNPDHPVPGIHAACWVNDARYVLSVHTAIYTYAMTVHKHTHLPPPHPGQRRVRGGRNGWQTAGPGQQPSSHHLHGAWRMAHVHGGGKRAEGPDARGHAHSPVTRPVYHFLMLTAVACQAPAKPRIKERRNMPNCCCGSVTAWHRPSPELGMILSAWT